MANPDKIQNGNLTNRGRGRPKGSPNKITAEAKNVIATAAEQLGGTKRLVEWAKEDVKNESAFWSSIYPKLLPLQVTGHGGGPIDIRTLQANAAAEVGELFGPPRLVVNNG